MTVSGLNPHATEGGMFGDDEALIAPTIADARQSGIAADGPYGTTTIFHKQGYDACVVMYHDQGHIAAKAMAIDRTAALTIGTPILFHRSRIAAPTTSRAKIRRARAGVIEAILRSAAARSGTRAQ